MDNYTRICGNRGRGHYLSLDCQRILGHIIHDDRKISDALAPVPEQWGH